MPHWFSICLIMRTQCITSIVEFYKNVELQKIDIESGVK